MSSYDLCPPTPWPNPTGKQLQRALCQAVPGLNSGDPALSNGGDPAWTHPQLLPQNTAVGSSASAAVGSALSAGGVPISSGSSLGFGSFGYPGLGSGYSWPYHCYNTYQQLY